MSTLHRYLRFNLVGLLGMALQLTTLHLLIRAWHIHYLLATAAALELTLLHNFAWHWHYTWRDRRAQTSPLIALLRFHLTNGLSSLIGNLALTRLLVHTFHRPVLFANLAAILTCSVLNFFFTHKWSLAPGTSQNSVASKTATSAPSSRECYR